jgi:lipoprotein-anchoring transpeptidase ErfK/SrfK
VAAVALSLASVAGTAQTSPEPTPERRRIVVSLADRKLALVENERVLKVYDIAVGAAPTPTPTGEFRVVNRLTDPTYYKPGVVIPAGASNPLGPRWIGLSKKTFGIHGTSEAGSIGHAASSGCVRLRNHDVKELFELVRVGDIVEIYEGGPNVARWLAAPATETARAASSNPETKGGL